MDRPWATTLVLPAQERRAPGFDEASPSAPAGSDATAPHATALLAAADADADALADRLHDGALQALVVARYAADAAVRGGDPSLARDAVQEALVALRRAVWLLRPRGADGLPAALAELSAQRVAAGAAPLELRVDDAVADALPPVARALAYRFVQAADADVVEVAADGDTAVVLVARAVDDPASWAARARALGGRLHADAAATRLVLPLTRSDPEVDR